MQSLFKPGSKINQDHKHKYIHILAYAASVVETWKKVQSRGASPTTDRVSVLRNPVTPLVLIRPDQRSPSFRPIPE